MDYNLGMKDKVFPEKKKLKIKCRITIWFSTFSSEYILKELKVGYTSVHSSIIIHHVHSSIIHSSWEVETTRMSNDRWKDKQITVHQYNRILFSPVKEGNSDTGYDVDEPRGC